MTAPRTYQSALVAGFALALGMLVVAAVLDWRQNRRVEETTALVARTHEAQSTSNRLLSLVQDIETGERGFILTGDPAFLEPFEDALATVGAQERRLEELVVSDEQRASLTVMKSLIAERIAVSRRNVALRRTAGFEAARLAETNGEGKAVMDAVRAQHAQMDLRAQALLGERTALARREAENAILLNSSIIGLSAIVLITVFALVLRENRLRQHMHRELDRFFTLSLDMLCIVGMNGYFKRLSPAFSQILGYSTDELQVHPFLNFIHPDDRDATAAELESLRDGRPAASFQNRYQCQDGSWKWLSWKAHPVVEEGLVYAIARDVTWRKEAEAKVEQLNADLRGRAARLEEANTELESFSYSVSHDLRAPLRHVHGYVEMLQRATDGQLSTQARRYLHTIADASLEMGQLIDDLLAFSRMARTEVQESRVTLDAIVRDVIHGMELAVNGRNIVWRTNPLPPVVGDPSLLKQVLANLIGNAVKYTRMRDPANIEVGCAGEEDGRVIVFVRDNGAGFDMQYASKLFGVFQRLHRAEEFEGTGIGLATVRRIMARHGGRVWAEGAVNEGATFYFTLKQSPSA